MVLEAGARTLSSHAALSTLFQELQVTGTPFVFQPKVFYLKLAHPCLP